MDVKVEIEKEEAWRRVLAIEVSAQDAEREYERVARGLARKVKVKGFRKGKVPVSIVRKSFKPELDQEFLEDVVPKAFGRALEETGLDPISEPRFEDLSFGAEKPLSFRADFESRPDVEPKDYKGIAAEKEVPEVTEEHVERILEEFRKSKADLVDVERQAVDGDVLLVDYHAVDSGGKPLANRSVKDYSVELGAGRVVEEFEKALHGAEAGQVKTAQVPYPEDHSDPHLAGSTASYKIKVRKVQEKRFPSLTDELVKEHTEAESLDAFREKVRENLEKQADRAGVERLEQMLMDRVVDGNPFDAPGALVDGMLEDFIARQRQTAEEQGEDPDQVVEEERIRTEARPSADRQVRRVLLMEAIARAEKIGVEDREMGERIAVMAHLHGMPPKRFLERMGGDRFLRRLRHEIRDKKVLAFLVENAEISVKKVPARPSEV